LQLQVGNFDVWQKRTMFEFDVVENNLETVTC